MITAAASGALSGGGSTVINLVGGTIAGDFTGLSISANGAETGYRFATPIGGMTPYAAVQAQRFHTPAYAETDISGGSFALNFNARTATDTRNELGGRFD